MTAKKFVEKCGVCGESFIIDDGSNHCGIMTSYVVPDSFQIKGGNILSKTSAFFPTGISFVCKECCDKSITKNQFDIKWIHNVQKNIDVEKKGYQFFKAHPVSNFKKVPEDIKVMIEMELKFTEYRFMDWRGISEIDFAPIIKKFLADKNLTELELGYLKWYIVQYIDGFSITSSAIPENYRKKIIECNINDLKDYLDSELLSYVIDPF
jgi:hypothetical protein